MEIGTVFPQLEIGDDPARIRDYATRVEAAGYDHLLAYDHVLGVNPAWADWEGPYDNDDAFHEPLSTFAYLAGLTEEIEFVTGILILPQRQTALVAKQAAQVDRLSQGRLRLGVGNGWNPYEYRALDEDFSVRGRRIEEQITVLRRLWTEDAVDFDGDFHEIPDLGINPRPVQQPIPIWLGGMAEPVKRRIARLGDGWIPQFQPGSEASEHLEDLAEYAADNDRELADIGLHGRMTVDPDDPDGWVDRAREWSDLGADYLAVNTMYQGLEYPSNHITLLERVADRFADADLL